MKKITFALIIMLAVVFMASQCDMSDGGGTILPSSDSSFKPCFCADTTNCDALCATLSDSLYLAPSLFRAGYQGSLDTARQPFFDQFGWQTFVALNWPADENGKVLANKPIGSLPDNKRVWEYFTTADQLFGNTEGCAYCKADCDDLFIRIAKSEDEMEEFDGKPLIDKNLNFVVYNVNINATEEKRIKQLMANYDKLTKDSTVNLPLGSIELKSSWRVLDIQKDKQAIANKEYYTRNATIYVEAENSVTGKPQCISATLGLVGLHIAYKVARSFAIDPWLWITFEHIDNVPTINGGEVLKSYSFYDGYSPEFPFNQPPKETTYKWAEKPPYAAAYGYVDEKNDTFGTQVIRATDIFSSTQQMNKKWQTKLKGTPFANYQMIGTQWGIVSDGPPAPMRFFPALLANTTQETYIQASSSCGNCHAFASLKLKDGTKLDGDHSFLIDDIGNLKNNKVDIQARTNK